MNTRTKQASPDVLGFAFPNPASSETIIPYSLPLGSQTAKIVIKNIVTGREIQAFILEAKDRNGKITVNLQNFTSGIYTYSLVIDGKPVSTRKMSVVK